MLGYPYFAWSHIRNYVIAFGAIFDDISITRPNGDIIKVPVSYGPKDKMLARMEYRETNGVKGLVAITMPRIAFEISGFTYDPTRHINKSYKFVKLNNTSDLSANNQIEEYTNNFVRTTYTPAPYDIEFNIFVMTKTETDGALIMDQIMPMFSPELNVTLKIAPNPDVAYDPTIRDYISNFRDNMELVFDTPVLIDSVTMSDDYAGDFTQRRALIWTLGFIVKGVFLGPTHHNRIIKLPEVGLFASDKDSEYYRIKSTPYTPTKNWVEISISDKDSIKWLDQEIKQ